MELTAESWLSAASERRLRSCMSFWLASWLFQKSGTETLLFNHLQLCLRLAGMSKIAPHSFRLLAERRVFPLEFVEGHDDYLTKTPQTASDFV